MPSLRLMLPAVLCATLSLLTSAQEMKFYFIDVDGGQATLVVSDTGESMLVDAGWPGYEGRDARKIAAAAKDAGISRIDYMLTTHYHTDHVGGVPELSAFLPVKTYVDHGENTERSANAAKLFASYQVSRQKGNHRTVAAGDTLSFGGGKVHIVSAKKQLLAHPLKAPNAGTATAACADVEPMKGDGSENEMSIGVVVEFGRFRMLDLGDLLWNEEMALVCPTNKIGDIDLYLTTHHGFRASGNPALVNAIRPRVAIMNNGAKKGGDPERWNTVKAVPGLVDGWQTQKSIAGDGSHNVDDDRIASLAPQTQPSWIKVVARNDGSFTVSNSRNGVSKTYGPRQ